MMMNRIGEQEGHGSIGCGQDEDLSFSFFFIYLVSFDSVCI